MYTINGFWIFPTFFLLTSCTNFLFVPFTSFPLTPDAVELTYKNIYLDIKEGLTLHGWKMLAETEKTEGEKKGSILFFHGNGDNVSTQLPNTYWLAKEGYDLYVFDYREYGLSQGKADLDSTISDMEMMIGYVVKQLENNEKLIIIGHSLGAAMAIHVVAHSNYRKKIEALITVEAFSDYHDVTQDVLSKSWLFWLLQWPLSFTIDNSYRPLDAIALIAPIPLLILHSESDEMIDMYHANRLFEAADEPKSFSLIDSDHSNIFIKIENRDVLLDYFSKRH